MGKILLVRRLSFLSTLDTIQIEYLENKLKLFKYTEFLAHEPFIEKVSVTEGWRRVPGVVTPHSAFHRLEKAIPGQCA